MVEEGGRIVGRDEVEGRGRARERGSVVGRTAEQTGDGGVGPHREEVRRRATGHERLNTARNAGVGSWTFEPVFRPGHGEQRGEVSPGRVAVGGDPLRIELELVGVRAHPSDGFLHVVDLRREAMPRGQPVLRRDGQVALLREASGDAGHVALVPAEPAARVDHDDAGEASGGRAVDIGA